MGVDTDKLVDDVYSVRVCPEIRKLGFTMEKKFYVHNERGTPFKPLGFDYLNDRFHDEYRELITAMGLYNEPRQPPSEVWNEVADCCNFLLMMAVNYERIWRARKSTEDWVNE